MERRCHGLLLTATLDCARENNARYSAAAAAARALFVQRRRPNYFYVRALRLLIALTCTATAERLISAKK